MYAYLHFSHDNCDWLLKNIYSQTFKKNWFSRKACRVYMEASSSPHEALGCVLGKLGSTDPGDPGPLRFRDHLFIHTSHSLIHHSEKPQVSGWWLSQQLSRRSPSPPTHESLTCCPLLRAWKQRNMLQWNGTWAASCSPAGTSASEGRANGAGWKYSLNTTEHPRSFVHFLHQILLHSGCV